MFEYFKNQRRKKLKEQIFPEEWREHLKKDMPSYCSLPPADQQELEDHIKVLYGEKQFVGANDLVITDAMRVLICGQAAILLLHRDPHYFPNVDTIVIYPDAFVSNITQSAGGGFYLNKPLPRVGEFCEKTGVIVLSWHSVHSGMANPKDGKNVVLHEFAHQLDSETGSIDGAPVLCSTTAYRAWSATMSHEFNDLKKTILTHHKTFIDSYGATSPAEFFAVLTEAFFEKPLGLKKKHPQVYELLAKFYQQDPLKR